MSFSFFFSFAHLLWLQLFFFFFFFFYTLSQTPSLPRTPSLPHIISHSLTITRYHALSSTHLTTTHYPRPVGSYGACRVIAERTERRRVWETETRASQATNNAGQKYIPDFYLNYNFNLIFAFSLFFRLYFIHLIFICSHINDIFIHPYIFLF